jgi:hypothetical protein
LPQDLPTMFIIPWCNYHLHCKSSL